MQTERIASDEERIEQLRREHRALDQQVTEMESRIYLSPAEEAEVKRLKRLKLSLKDELAVLGRRR